MTLTVSVTYVENIFLKSIKGLLQILFAKYTVLTLELNLVTKTSHGLHMLSANHVLSTYECGQKEKLKALDLVCQWCGENRKNHFDDCYFCMVDFKGFNRHKKKSWIYPDLESARRPVPHCEDIPVPQFSHLPEKPSEWDFVHQASESSSESNVSSIFEESSTSPKQFNQEELSDLIRDLYLSKEASEVLGIQA